MRLIAKLALAAAIALGLISGATPAAASGPAAPADVEDPGGWG